jgi:PEP-CTERM motif
VPYTADGDLIDTITVGTTAKTVSIPFVATIGASSNSLSVPSATFVVGGYQFVTLPLTFADVSDSQPQILEATISPVAVPEPSTWAMMLIGFTGLVFAGYWTKAVSA